jgi:hypothetical protein
MKYTNKHNLPLSMAVMLATDWYDHTDAPNTISTTALLKSTREVILTNRIPVTAQSSDVSTLLASRLGTALHDALEKSWRNPKLPEVLASLGIAQGAIKNIRVEPEEHDPDMLNIYLERRTNKEVMGWTVSGQFDMIIDGCIYDLKSTGTFKYGKDSPEYTQQLSIYRWLNPELITEEEGKILFWFKDWNKNISYTKETYPSQPIIEKRYKLMDLRETERFICDKLSLLDFHVDTDEPDLPHCTPAELWQGAPVWKYYGKPDALKASKVLHSAHEAQMHLGFKGKGYIKKIDSEPTKCKWCAAAGTCSQAANFISQGVLKLS